MHHQGRRDVKKKMVPYLNRNGDKDWFKCLLSKRQIKWVITPNFCGLLRKAELYLNAQLDYISLKKLITICKNKVCRQNQRKICVQCNGNLACWPYKILFYAWSIINLQGYFLQKVWPKVFHVFWQAKNFVKSQRNEKTADYLFTQVFTWGCFWDSENYFVALGNVSLLHKTCLKSSSLSN